MGSRFGAYRAVFPDFGTPLGDAGSFYNLGPNIYHLGSWTLKARRCGSTAGARQTQRVKVPCPGNAARRKTRKQTLNLSPGPFELQTLNPEP